ncbi:MAG: AAA family ATPase [Caldilineaceae bacterium]
MPDPHRLQILADLRRQARPRLSQAAVAAKFELDLDYGRKAVGTWERGENSPDKSRRRRFIGYLWDDLGLRHDPAKFEEVWQILVEEWQWDAISDEEWQDFTVLPRPKASTVPTAELTPPPLPTPRTPPASNGLIGRQQELLIYQQMLKDHNVAILSGLVGVGKTTLAAQLALTVAAPDKIFWHTCYEQQSIDAIIWELAEFLAWQGQDELWRLLHTGIQAGGRPPTNALLDYLFQALRNQHYLLCFDDFHHIDADATQKEFVDRLQQAITSGHCQVIVTAQQVLDFGRRLRYPLLTGLNRTDTQALLRNRQITLTPPEFEQLYIYTDGNAELLMLALAALQHSDQRTRLLEHLAHSEQIRQFLLDEVDKELTNDERAVMHGVAAFLTYPATAAAIEEVLDGEDDVPRTLTQLSQRYLLQERLTAIEAEYSQHAIVQAFYYGLLGRRARQAMHRRAATYYEFEEQNLFRAAIHYHHAQEHEYAATLATENVRLHLYRGNVNALQSLLARFTARQLSPELWGAVQVALGQVYAFLESVANAQRAYETAYTYLMTLPTSPMVNKLLVETCRELGFLLRGRQPEVAQQWLQRGLGLLTTDPVAEADLRIQQAIILGKIQNNEAALRELHHAHTLLNAEIAATPRVQRLRLLALINLSIRYFYANDLAQSDRYLQQAEQLAQQLGDRFNLLSVQTNRAAYRQIAGDWHGALHTYEQAEQLAAALGNRQEQIKLQLNSGVLYTQMGDFRQAQSNLTAAVTGARQIAHNELIVASLGYWAELALLQGNLTTAFAALTEAEDLCTTHQIEYQRAFLTRLRALYAIERADYLAAIDHATQALALARQAGMTQEESSILRALGQAQLAAGQTAAGEASLQQSIEAAHHNPYELACTQQLLGHYFISRGSLRDGQELLQQAAKTFATLQGEGNLIS